MGSNRSKADQTGACAIPDSSDQQRLRHARERNEGFAVSDYVQPAPLLFTRDGHALYLGDTYRGRSAFLVAGGPSFATIDSSKLNLPGCLTMALNNAVHSYRPDLWVSVDDPTHFMKSIWLDPKIAKFVPLCHAEKTIFDNEEWRQTDHKVGDCPNVVYFRRNERFRAAQFLTEDTVNWGDHARYGGGRSVMLAAFRLLYFLGVREIFLLGVDFKMTAESRYHFEQSRSRSSIRGNNSTYRKLADRFGALVPHFEERGLRVFNCNPDSELKVFPFIGFDEAVERCREGLPREASKERSDGMYDRAANERDLKRDAEPDASRTVISVKSLLKELDALREGEEHLARAVYTLSDGNYDTLLPWWYENLSRHNDLPVVVFDLGVSEEIKRWAGHRIRFVKIPRLPVDPPHGSVVKPFALVAANAERGLFLDLDCEVRGDLAPLFAAHGRGLSLERDPVPTGQFKEQFTASYYNTGVIGFGGVEPLIRFWAIKSGTLLSTARSDREVLNMLAPNYPELIHPFPEGAVKLRLGGEGATDPIVVHWTGPKGKDAIRSTDAYKEALEAV